MMRDQVCSKGNKQILENTYLFGLLSTVYGEGPTVFVHELEYALKMNK